MVEVLVERAVGHIVGVCSTDSVRRGGVGELPNLLRGSVVVVEGYFQF